MCQSSYNTLGDFHHVCFEVRNDKRGRGLGRISVRFLFPFLRGLASSVSAPKKEKELQSQATFFSSFFLCPNAHSRSLHRSRRLQQLFMYSSTAFFLLQTSRKWVPKSIKHISGSFPPGNPYQVPKVRVSLPNLGGALFLFGVRLLQAPLSCWVVHPL